MNPSKASLDQIFESHIRSLAVTHQPGTLRAYRGAARRFLRCLHHAFPQLRRLAQLRRESMTRPALSALGRIDS